MKANIISITITLLSLSSAAFAGSNTYYGDSSDNAYYGESRQEKGMEWKIGKDVSVSVNIPGSNNYPRRPRVRLRWVDMIPGRDMPMNAVVGGGEGDNPNLFVCHANYRGGVHPGKVVGDNCNISWGGRELPMARYQVLVSSYPLNWVPGNNGSIPGGAIPGGYENGKPLYICQASYNDGVHPGKLVGQSCNIAWGGKEVSISDYNVLVG